uniref:Oligopeptide transporter n=1 Tax=Quercus lobata TaxID=97700 RepID=A0A7N2KUS9_QUELO
MLTSLSWICWTSPKSVLAQQLGSGLNGLGLFAFGLDWATISSYLGSPLASPWFATANVVGYVFVVYILTPICYWLNVFSAKTFPIYSQDLFSSTSQEYNISLIINNNFHFDTDAYSREGPLYISTFFSMTYGVGFASLAALVVHVALFHGRDIWEQSKSSFLEKTMDIHTKLMRKYKQVPELWFVIILIATITMGLSLFACEYYKDQLQLPWWGVLLACGIAFFFTLPIGIIATITNQAQAVTFLQDFKLDHYMKIPPRTMFMAQHSMVANRNHIPNICMDETSVWSCPSNRTFYAASVIWGLVSPRRIFGNLGTYQAINWFFLGGAVAPIIAWLATKAFPNQKWIRLINMPVLIGATGSMPPATAVNYTNWILLGFLSGFVVYRYKPDWWQRHNYVLSGAFDAGLAFMAVLIYFFLGMEEVSLNWWGNNLDRCPFASCPTAKGVVAGDGCPVF